LFDALRLLLKAQNLLNGEYETFGVIADPSDVLPRAHNPRFVAPVAVWHLDGSGAARTARLTSEQPG
jgi:hypothetical protein